MAASAPYAAGPGTMQPRPASLLLPHVDVLIMIEPSLEADLGARRLVVVVLTLLAALSAGFLMIVILRLARLISDPANYSHTDFFAIWSCARLLLHDGAAAVYDQPSLFAAQIALGRDAGGVPPLPFAYPPSFLLMIWPLGLLGHGPAFGAWIAVTLSLYLCAVAAGQPRGALLLLAALIVPSTSLVIIFGQSGLLAGALLVGGMRLAPTRQILGGVLLAC